MVTYTYTVTNTSTRPLYYDGLSDDKCTDFSLTGGLRSYFDWYYYEYVYYLNPGETATWTCRQSITQTTTNTATASFYDANGITSTATAAVTVTMLSVGSVSCDTLWYAADAYASRNGTVGTISLSPLSARPAMTISDGSLVGSAAVAVSPVSPNLVYYIPRTSDLTFYGGLWVFNSITGTRIELTTSAATPDGVRLAAAPNGTLFSVVNGTIYRYTPTSATSGTWSTLGATTTDNGYAFADGFSSSLSSGDLAFDGNGTLFLIGSDTSGRAYLYTVPWTDLTDGSGAVARSLGQMGTGQFNGLAFRENGTLYATVIDGSGNGLLYTVDPPNGTTAPVGTLSGQMTTDLGSCALPKPQLQVLKEVSPNEAALQVGDVLAYTITVSNLGTLPSTLTTLTDVLPAGLTYVAGSARLDGVQVTTGDTFPYASAREIHSSADNSGIVATGAKVVVTFSATVGVSSPEICNQGAVIYVGSAQGGVASDDPGQPGGTDSTCSRVVLPKIAVDKTAPITVLTSSPQTVTYTYALTNVGSEALQAVTLRDNKCADPVYASGDLNTDGLLQIGETWIYTCTSTLSETTTNTATATALGSSTGRSTTATDSWTITKPAQSLTVTKSNSGLLDLDPAGPNAGDQINYSYLVRNTGETTLTSITVTDNKVPVTCPSSTLAPGAQMTCWATYTVTAADVTSGSVTNTASATGQSGFGITTSPTVANTVNLPPLTSSTAITVTKSATPTTLPVGGGSVTYTYDIKNDSAGRLYFYSASDDKCATITYASGGGTARRDPLGTLRYIDPGQTIKFTCTSTLTQSTTNTASFTFATLGQYWWGDFYWSTAYTEQDTATVLVTAANPLIALTKTAGAVSDLDSNGQSVGDLLAYSFTVRNTGNVALTTVVLSDAKCAAAPTRTGGDTNGDSILQTSETWTYTCTHPLTAAELTAGTVHNTATVTGKYGVDTVSSSASADKTLERPALNLVKRPGTLTANPDGTYQVGYTVTVANSGGAVGRYGPITDTPAFDSTLHASSATWTGPTGGASPPTGTATLGGATTSFSIGAADTEIDAGATHTYQVSVTVAFDRSAAPAACAGSGTGLYNVVGLPTGQESGSIDDNAACVQPPTTFSLTKTAQGGTAGGSGTSVRTAADGTVSATFTLVVTNTGHVESVHPSITDTIALPTGFTLTSVSVDGVGQAPLANPLTISGISLAAGASRTVIVVVTASTSTTGTLDWTVAGRCQTTGGGDPGAGGLFNLAAIAGDTTAGDDDACVPLLAPLATISVAKFGTACDVGVDQCPLIGAEFALYAADPATGATAIAGALTVSADGTSFTSIALEPLTDYWLVETTAPAGHNLLAAPLQFTLTATGISLVSNQAADSTLITIGADHYSVSIIDTATGTLPEAGGEGPWPYLALGLLLVTLGGWRHRRASRLALTG